MKTETPQYVKNNPIYWMEMIAIDIGERIAKLEMKQNSYITIQSNKDKIHTLRGVKRMVEKFQKEYEKSTTTPQ